MTPVRLSFLLMLCFSGASQAEIYRWVGADGKINYSDLPPPISVTKVETKSLPSVDKNDILPYELAQAVKNMPVVLYSSDNCSPCVDGRNFLKKNGIPFAEKTVSTNEDINKLTQISGNAQIPVLFIGRNKLVGFSSGDWHTNLTQAGYPELNMLSPSYHFPEPQPLVTTTIASERIQNNVQDSQPQSQSQLQPQPQPQPLQHYPNGFHF